MRVASDGYVAPDGRAAWAFACACGVRRAGALPDRIPSHLAEWRAVAEALVHLDVHPPGDVVVQVDSALVAKGLASRKPEMSGEAGELRAGCRQALARLADKGVRVQVQRVDREANAEADGLARRAVRPEGPSPSGG